jgi:hypothetical protein
MILILTVLDGIKLLPNMIHSHETRAQLFTGVIMNGCTFLHQISCMVKKVECEYISAVD